jgi:hypothetical protein
VKPKDVAVQQVVDGKVVISFMPAPHRRSLRGILTPRPKQPIKDWSEAQRAIERGVTADYLVRQRRASRQRGRRKA